MLYGITQCYLLPDTSECAPPNPSHTDWYSMYLPRRDGRLSWPSWLDSAPAGIRTSDLSITSPTPNCCTIKTTGGFKLPWVVVNIIGWGIAHCSLWATPPAYFRNSGWRVLACSMRIHIHKFITHSRILTLRSLVQHHNHYTTKPHLLVTYRRVFSLNCSDTHINTRCLMQSDQRPRNFKCDAYRWVSGSRVLLVSQFVS